MNKDTIAEMIRRFNGISKITDEGVEYWLARDLMNVLGYNNWRSFENVVIRAMTACKTAGYEVENYFINTYKESSLGKTGIRNMLVIWLRKTVTAKRMQLRLLKVILHYRRGSKRLSRID